jgi:hypothetical protein
MLTFPPRTLEKRRMNQDIRRRPELAEELLGREQSRILPYWPVRGTSSIA